MSKGTIHLIKPMPCESSSVVIGKSINNNKPSNETINETNKSSSTTNGFLSSQSQINSKEVIKQSLNDQKTIEPIKMVKIPAVEMRSLFHFKAINQDIIENSDLLPTIYENDHSVIKETTNQPNSISVEEFTNKYLAATETVRSEEVNTPRIQSKLPLVYNRIKSTHPQ